MQKQSFYYYRVSQLVSQLTPAQVLLKQKPRTRLNLLKPDLTKESKKQAIQPFCENKINGKKVKTSDNVLNKTVKGEINKWVPGKIMKHFSLSTFWVEINNNGNK